MLKVVAVAHPIAVDQTRGKDRSIACFENILRSLFLLLPVLISQFTIKMSPGRSSGLSGNKEGCSSTAVSPALLTILRVFRRSPS